MAHHSGDGAIRDLTSDEIHAAFDRALKEVQRLYAAGELDMSGRYYTDDELRELAKAQNSKDSPGAAA